MNRGVKVALLVSCAAAGSCAAPPAVKVRAIADRSAALRVGDAVATARGQFMLGNVGLALEGFRKAQRDHPYDPAALAGIGDCYSAMGRFDLAQSSYEAALALSPHDRKLLLGLAAIYERQGKTARAMIARAEATQSQPEASAVAAAHVAAARTRAPVPTPMPSVGTITIALPAAQPPSPAEATAVAAIPPEPAPMASETADVPPAAPAPAAASLAVPTPAQAAEIPVLSAATLIDQPVPKPVIRSITVELPAARPAERLEARAVASAMLKLEEAPSVAVELPPAPPKPAPLPRDAGTNLAMVEAVAPRLERLSRGEVALVTTAKPLWGSVANVRTASATTVRWVALASAPGRPNVRILNAARSQGLAASARSVLVDRGWRKIAVDDAPATQRQSVVLYPKGQEALGRRLARQFGLRAQMSERTDVVMVLGHDSVDRLGRQRGS